MSNLILGISEIDFVWKIQSLFRFLRIIGFIGTVIFLVVLLLSTILTILKPGNNSWKKLIKFSKIAIIFSVSLFILSFLFSIFAPSLFPCKEETMVFEYEGCKVEYREIIVDGNCSPCGGIMPCIRGFDYNSQVQIIECLCKSGKEEVAVEFTELYMPNVADMFDPVIEDVCENIPPELGHI